MSINQIPLSRLTTDPTRTLNECADSGQTFVVELPDHRLVAFQSLDPTEDDDLVQSLLDTNIEFQALVERSKQSLRKPFLRQ
jgi:hypothetical protein